MMRAFSTSLAVFVTFGLIALRTSSTLDAQPTAAAPAYRVDPFWPKEMPNDYLFGNVVGIAVDSKDYVWVTHRPRSMPGADSTPPVLEFDQAGTLINTF